MIPGVRPNTRREAEPRAPLINFARAFHARLPDSAPTPLLDLRPLARELGLGALMVKDESRRCGLPGHEVLGASWALYREVLTRLGRRPPRWETVEELSGVLAPAKPLRVVAVADSEFGVAAARAARWLGFDAVVYLPGTASPASIGALAAEGATVRPVGVTWEDALDAATTEARDNDLLLCESAWPGYEDIPRWVAEGYVTVFEEIDDELQDRGKSGADVVVVPLGVGALASAAGTYYRVERFPPGLALLGTESVASPCWTASVLAGERITLPGTGVTVMGSLARGAPCPVAWPEVASTFDAFITVDDQRAIEAVSRLAAHGVHVSPAGGAAFAGVLEGLASDSPHHGLGPTARVVVVVTEPAVA